MTHRKSVSVLFFYPDPPVPAPEGPVAGGPVSPPVPSATFSALFWWTEGTELSCAPLLTLSQRFFHSEWRDFFPLF